MMITNRTLISSKTRSLKKQSGLTSVEFSIVGFATLTILFGCLEVSRMMFVVNLLEEATRRGARVAAVCTIDSDLIAQTAVFNSTGGANSTILPDLTTGNIQVEYLNETGGTIGNPAPVPGNTGFTDIRYVRVQIINYQHEMIIPGFDLSFMTRGYPTTIPSESLGIAPINQTSGC
jgi:Flp pilus assembly protein TadG